MSSLRERPDDTFDLANYFLYIQRNLRGNSNCRQPHRYAIQIDRQTQRNRIENAENRVYAVQINPRNSKISGHQPTQRGSEILKSTVFPSRIESSLTVALKKAENDFEHSRILAILDKGEKATYS